MRVFFTLLTDRASTILSNIRGYQSDTSLLDREKIRRISPKSSKEGIKKTK